jgi:hypothetical protein
MKRQLLFILFCQVSTGLLRGFWEIMNRDALSARDFAIAPRFSPDSYSQGGN